MEEKKKRYKKLKGYNEDRLLKCERFLGGYQWTFDYGRYVVSVIKHKYSYGGSNDLFELALIDL